MSGIVDNYNRKEYKEPGSYHIMLTWAASLQHHVNGSFPQISILRSTDRTRNHNRLKGTTLN